MPLSHLQFMIATGRHRGALSDDPGLRDPLAAIVEIVTKTPYTPESRLLFQVVGGMRVDSNAYTESDIFVLDKRSLALVNALNSDVLAGRYSDAELDGAATKLAEARLLAT